MTKWGETTTAKNQKRSRTVPEVMAECPLRGHPSSRPFTTKPLRNLGKFFIYKFIFNSIKTTKIDCLVTINHRYSSKWSNVSNGSKEIKIFHDISISSNKQHFTSPYSTRLPAELLIVYPCATRSMTLQQKVFVRQNRSKMELGCQRPPLQKDEVGRGQFYPATT